MWGCGWGELLPGTCCLLGRVSYLVQIGCFSKRVGVCCFLLCFIFVLVLFVCLFLGGGGVEVVGRRGINYGTWYRLDIHVETLQVVAEGHMELEGLDFE